MVFLLIQHLHFNLWSHRRKYTAKDPTKTGSGSQKRGWSKNVDVEHVAKMEKVEKRTNS